MASFTPESPYKLTLSSSEELQRETAIKATGSPSPIPFAPITPVPTIYSHVGHAAQYGSGRRSGRTIRMIVLHVTDSDSTALGAAAYDARRPDSVSANAFVGPNGEIVYDVSESDRAFTTGRWNDESLGVEIVGKAAWTDAQWRVRSAQLESIVKLLVFWCKKYQIPAVWLVSSAVAQGASLQSNPPVQGVNRGITDHFTANQAAISLGGSPAQYSHTCVGSALRAIVTNELIAEVARRLNQSTPSSEDDMKLAVMTLDNTNPPTTFLGYMEPTAPDDAGNVNHKFWKVYWIDGNDPQAMKMLKDQRDGGAEEYHFGEHVSVSLFYENDRLPNSTHSDGRPWAKTDWGAAPNVK